MRMGGFTGPHVGGSAFGLFQSPIGEGDASMKVKDNTTEDSAKRFPIDRFEGRIAPRVQGTGG